MSHVAGMGAAFAFTEATAANIRETNDPFNGAAGGCAAGFLAGIRGNGLDKFIWTIADAWSLMKHGHYQLLLHLVL